MIIIIPKRWSIEHCGWVQLARRRRHCRKLGRGQGGVEDQPLEAPAGSVQPRNPYCARRYVPSMRLIIISIIMMMVMMILMMVVVVVLMITIQPWNPVPGDMFP